MKKIFFFSFLILFGLSPVVFSEQKEKKDPVKKIFFSRKMTPKNSETNVETTLPKEITSPPSSAYVINSGGARVIKIEKGPISNAFKDVRAPAVVQPVQKAVPVVKPVAQAQAVKIYKPLDT